MAAEVGVIPRGFSPAFRRDPGYCGPLGNRDAGHSFLSFPGLRGVRKSDGKGGASWRRCISGRVPEAFPG